MDCPLIDFEDAIHPSFVPVFLAGTHPGKAPASLRGLQRMPFAETPGWAIIALRKELKSLIFRRHLINHPDWGNAEPMVHVHSLKNRQRRSAGGRSRVESLNSLATGPFAPMRLAWVSATRLSPPQPVRSNP